MVEVYRPSAVTLARSLRRDAAAIKDALVTAIAKRHPDRPFDIKPTQYASCRKFVSAFDHIFTLNYDVLLYWALMQDKVDKLTMRHDDRCRHPEDDPDKPWASGSRARSAHHHGEEMGRLIVSWRTMFHLRSRWPFGGRRILSMAVEFWSNVGAGIWFFRTFRAVVSFSGV